MIYFGARVKLEAEITTEKEAVTLRAFPCVYGILHLQLVPLNDWVSPTPRTSNLFNLVLEESI
jgi:hypothetical protein